MWKVKQANKSSQGSHNTREMEDSSAEDLISDLPDELLLNIFSFLDETAIIQSSVLSRRWRYLWTMIPFPEHVKEERFYFNKYKMQICEEKLRLEEVARNTVSRVFIDIAKFFQNYFFYCLPWAFLEVRAMLDLLLFGFFYLLITLYCMASMYFSYRSSHFRLLSIESNLKCLQTLDFRLTSAANSTSKPMELLFPDNFELRYAKTAKLYGLFWILLVMIISCSIAVLGWNRGEPREILFRNLCFSSSIIISGVYFRSILVNPIDDDEEVDSVRRTDGSGTTGAEGCTTDSFDEDEDDFICS